MAEIWGAAIVAGAALVGSYESSQSSKNAANKAAQAQENAANQANATQLQMYNQTRSDLQPYAQAGQGALNQLGALYGTNGQAPDYSGFENSPDYQFALQQGTQNLDRSAAAKGRLYSGGYGEDLTQFAQGLASQNLNNYANRLQGLAGMGENAAGMGGQFASQYGMQNGMNLMNSANAAANGYMNNAAANQSFYNQLGQIGGYFGSQYMNNAYGNPYGVQTYNPQMSINPGQPQAQYTAPSDLSMPMEPVQSWGGA